jgi:hypothetical protein
MNRIIALLIITLFFPFASSAGGIKSDTTVCLLVDGKIINAAEGHNLCTVELIEGDKVVEVLELKGTRKKFAFNLRRDKHYIIRIRKDGFATKNICIHTALPAGTQQQFKFEFETKLSVTRPNMPAVNDRDGNTVASIYYHEKKQNFHYSKTFSAQYQGRLCKSYTN